MSPQGVAPPEWALPVGGSLWVNATTLSGDRVSVELRHFEAGRILVLVSDSDTGELHNSAVAVLPQESGKP